MLELLGANLPQLPHGRFFDWLYCKNPEGPALTPTVVRPISAQQAAAIDEDSGAGRASFI